MVWDQSHPFARVKALIRGAGISTVAMKTLRGANKNPKGFGVKPLGVRLKTLRVSMQNP